MAENMIAKRFKVGKKIGAGSFGEIYKAIDTETHKEVAVKLENVNTKYRQLLYESRLIKSIEGGLGLPEIHWFGTEGMHNIMVLDLLGPSLEKLFVDCSQKLSLKTVLMIVDQMLCRIEYVHSKGFIHRDIKPDNFLIGSDKRCTILYIIDFGLSKKYKDLKTGKHIPNSGGKSLTGTARYASINAHIGNEQSRRDDLEAIGYVLVYFLKGNLPWQGINAKNRDEKYRLIMAKKRSTTTEELCQDLPEAFKEYFEYVKSLKFEENPDYVKMRKIFKNAFAAENFVYDYQFDWTLMNHPAAESQNLPFMKNFPEEKKKKSKTVEEKENEKEKEIENELELRVKASGTLQCLTPMMMDNQLLEKEAEKPKDKCEIV